MCMREIVTSLNEIFKACVEPDTDKDFPETIIDLSYGILKECEEVNFNKSITISKVKLRLSKYDNFMELVINFFDNKSTMLKNTFKMLRDYQNARQELPNDVYPCLHFSLTPMSLKGRYTLIMANPVFYALCSEDINRLPSALKIIFWTDECIISQNDDIDYDKMVQKIRREIDDEQFYQAKQAEKDQRIKE